MGIQVRELRTDLEILLASRLGTYTLGNGTQTPAVAVRADSEGLAAGTSVQGLELVINRHPSLDPVRQYLQEQCAQSWDVWLLAWSDNAQITEAAAQVVATYPGTTAQVITLPESWGPKRQIQLTIQEPLDLPLVLRDVDGGDFRAGIGTARVAAVLDSGNFFDGSTSNTYTATANGGVFT